jgi:hypothetical protein
LWIYGNHHEASTGASAKIAKKTQVSWQRGGSMSETTVVNVRRDKFDVYIGRAMKPPFRIPDPRCRQESVYANPFHFGRRYRRTRQETIDLYEALWRQRLASKSRQLWLTRLLALEGQRLGCWCAPEPCHGDVLVMLLKEWLERRADMPATPADREG